MKKILMAILVVATSLGLYSFTQPKKPKAKKSKEVKAEVLKEDANAELVWFTDVMKADSIAKKQNKTIFGFFTGSDWCGWCHKLQREVFAKQDFKTWAKKNVVLLELDFPRRKQLPANLQQQNGQLAQAFQVSGYPTVWLFTIAKDSTNPANMQLQALGSLGYPSGAVEGKEELKFLENANEILAKKK